MSSSKLELNCEESQADLAKTLWKKTGLRIFWPFVKEHCQLIYRFPKISFNEMTFLKRYTCKSEGNNVCPFQVDDENSVMCLLFKKPVNVENEDGSERFKNIFCVRCSTNLNGKNKTIQNTCQSDENLKTTLLVEEKAQRKFILSVTSTGAVSLTYEDQTICHDGTFLDEEMNICKTIVCEPTKSGVDCIKEINIKQILSDQNANYAITLQTSRDVSESSIANIVQLFENNGIFMRNTIPCKSLEIDITELQNVKVLRNCFLLLVDNNISWDAKVLIDKAKVIAVILKASLFSGQLEMSLIQLNIQNENNFKCIVGQKERRSAEIKGKENDGTELLFTPLTKLTYTLSDVPWHVSLDDSEESTEIFVNVLVCEPQILSCETKVIYENDYQIKNLSNYFEQKSLRS